MRQYYFFRNVNNYEELKNKTYEAIRRKSKNMRNVNVFKRIEIDQKEFDMFTCNLLQTNKILFEYLKEMKIINGVWYCIRIGCEGNGILIMTDGYQYPRFTALDI